MRGVGIPMIKADPIELGTQIALHIGYEIAGESLEIAHFGGILRADDEPEMMPVVFAPFRKSLVVGAIASAVEHLGIAAVHRDALTLEIGDVRRKRRRTEAPPAMPYDARFDDDAARRVEQPFLS